MTLRRLVGGVVALMTVILFGCESREMPKIAARPDDRMGVGDWCGLRVRALSRDPNEIRLRFDLDLIDNRNAAIALRGTIGCLEVRLWGKPAGGPEKVLTVPWSHDEGLSGSSWYWCPHRGTAATWDVVLLSRPEVSEALLMQNVTVLSLRDCPNAVSEVSLRLMRVPSTLWETTGTQSAYAARELARSEWIPLQSLSGPDGK